MAAVLPASLARGPSHCQSITHAVGSTECRPAAAPASCSRVAVLTLRVARCCQRQSDASLAPSSEQARRNVRVQRLAVRHAAQEELRGGPATPCPATLRDIGRRQNIGVAPPAARLAAPLEWLLPSLENKVFLYGPRPHRAPRASAGPASSQTGEPQRVAAQWSSSPRDTCGRTPSPASAPAPLYCRCVFASNASGNRLHGPAPPPPGIIRPMTRCSVREPAVLRVGGCPRALRDHSNALRRLPCDIGNITGRWEDLTPPVTAPSPLALPPPENSEERSSLASEVS